MRYVLIDKFASDTGYTRKAIEEKIAKGIWTQGKEYKRAPDRHIMVDLKGYEAWVEKGVA